jgi:hypothetical protein
METLTYLEACVATLDSEERTIFLADVVAAWRLAPIRAL